MQEDNVGHEEKDHPDGDVAGDSSKEIKEPIKPPTELDAPAEEIVEPIKPPTSPNAPADQPGGGGGGVGLQPPHPWDKKSL